MKWLLVLLSTTAWAAGGPKVFVGDHLTYHESGFVSGANGSVVGGSTAYEKGNTEQVKTLNKACPALAITSNQADAQYVISWESRTYQETPWGSHQQEFAIYKADGTLVGSGATHKIGNAGKEICKLLTARR